VKECALYAPMLGAHPGELSTDEEARLNAHLAFCDACQGRLADLSATEGMLAEALSRAAARRDFTDFADGVMARIPASAWRTGAPEKAGGLRSLKAFLGRHKVLAVVSAVAPALAAAALFLFVERSGGPEPASPGVEVTSETLSPVVLDTSDGPVILMSDSEGT